METEKGDTKMRNGTQRDCLSVCGCAHGGTDLQALRRFLPPSRSISRGQAGLAGAQLDRKANSLSYDTVFLTRSAKPNTQTAPRPVTQTACPDNPVAPKSACTGDDVPQRSRHTLSLAGGLASKVAQLQRRAGSGWGDGRKRRGCSRGEKAGPRGRRFGSPRHLCLESALSAGLLVETRMEASTSLFWTACGQRGSRPPRSRAAVSPDRPVRSCPGAAFQERRALTTHQGPGSQVARTKAASGTCKWTSLGSPHSNFCLEQVNKKAQGASGPSSSPAQDPKTFLRGEQKKRDYLERRLIAVWGENHRSAARMGSVLPGRVT
ncbi:uncharacterized protein LOC125101186 [Lutra lutra]|uniref:uncharacterized protein LOC125101186 n=1 Tax=Lutra lutra TaxID=9657 RepID=UPI001FD465D2|nr:uncharacterized protein LOC125101186 [Lutra lutra]